MKPSSLIYTGFIILFLVYHSALMHAQHVSFQKADGTNKTSSEIKSEEYKNKQNQTPYNSNNNSTNPSKTKEYYEDPKEKEEQERKSKEEDANRKAILDALPTNGVKYDYINWYTGDYDSRTVSLKGRWGIINKDGKVIIPLIYSRIGDLLNGVCPVQSSGSLRWYFIDDTGAKNGSSTYGSVIQSNGRWSGKVNDKWEDIYKLGPATVRYDIKDINEGLIVASLQRKIGFVDKDGKTVIPFLYDFADRFVNGVAVVSLNGEWGAIDKQGKEVIPLKYVNHFRFINDRAVVREEHSKWGYINNKGETVIPFVFWVAREFKDSLAIVGSETSMGFIDLNGNSITKGSLNTIYTNVKEFSDGLAAVQEYKNKKWGFIDKKGNTVIRKKYSDAFSFSEGMAMVELDGYWGCIDKSGIEIIPTEFSLISNFVNGKTQAILMKDTFYFDRTGKQIGGKTKFIPKVSAEIKNAPYYDFYGEYSEDLAIVGLEERFGYIDKNKNLVIPLIFELAYPFNEGLAGVKEANGKYGFIDKSGKTIIPFEYTYTYQFKEGIARVSLYTPDKSRLVHGYIDKNNKIIIPIIYSELSSINEEGKISAKLKYDDKKFIYFDKTGARVKK